MIHLFMSIGVIIGGLVSLYVLARYIIFADTVLTDEEMELLEGV